MGLPLDWADLSGNRVFPMAALVVLKAVDSAGDEVFAVIPTEGLSTVDALGMAHYAVLYTEHRVKENSFDH